MERIVCRGNEELHLRGPALSDEEVWGRLRNNPDVAEAIGLRKLGDELKGWEASGYGVFLVVEEPHVVGLAGLANPLRNEGPHLICAIEPEWRGLVCEGRTRAFFACQEVVRWAQGRGLEVYAHAALENKGGIRLAETLGATRVHPTAEGCTGDFFADFRFEWAGDVPPREAS